MFFSDRGKASDLARASSVDTVILSQPKSDPEHCSQYVPEAINVKNKLAEKSLAAVECLRPQARLAETDCFAVKLCYLVTFRPRACKACS